MKSPEQLYEISLFHMERDLAYIGQELTKGKLSPSASRDLIAYHKALSDIRAEDQKAAKSLSKLSPEQLEAMAKELLKSTDTK